MSPGGPGRRRALVTAGIGVLTATVFAGDVVTGSELSFSLFYLAPVALAAWFLGRSAGWIASLAAVIGWITAYRLTGRPDPHHAVLVWNALMEAGTYATIAWAVSAIRLGLDRERSLTAELETAVRRLDREERRVGDIQRSLMPAIRPFGDDVSLVVVQSLAPSLRAAAADITVRPALASIPAAGPSRRSG